ncbi:MAG: peptidoglycan DD-metalloendopeptidase family protein, partial [Novosphingobium sp.]
RAALAQAQAEGRAARMRAEKLEAEAARATEALEKTARAAAGIAARIQQDEARIATHEARIRLIARQRAQLNARLAERQRPLVRLTAALQRLSRRPAALTLLRPGSVRDAMYMRALLETMLPEVRRRTAGLRAQIAEGKKLEEQARLTARDLRTSQAELRLRRESLVALETRQRLASRAVSGGADREAERALALAEQARDLDALAADIGKQGELRATLAALPGPVLRPASPAQATLAPNLVEPAASPAASTGPGTFILPVAGRLVAGFGDVAPGQVRSRGIALAARSGAIVVAPAAGRIAFAGPYRGYAHIVIIEHAGGWTSLVTGLADLDSRVGQAVVAGSPLGRARAGRPVIGLETRRTGMPTNPLDLVQALQ